MATDSRFTEHGSSQMAFNTDPNKALCDRLDSISRSIAGSQVDAKSLLQLDRLFCTAESLLDQPRALRDRQDGNIESYGNDVSIDNRFAEVIRPTSPFESRAGTEEVQAPTQSVLDHVAQQLQHFASEMEKRAEESHIVSEAVELWRHTMLTAIRDLQANQQQSLAELRYLKHKLNRLDERIAYVAGPDDMPTGRRGKNREPVTAALVTSTVGIPPRLSSLASSTTTELQKALPEDLEHLKLKACVETSEYETEHGQASESNPVRIDSLVSPTVSPSIRLVDSPQSIRHQVWRARREVGEVEQAMENRQNLADDVLDSLHQE